MDLLGLTGDIASGKSTVAELLVRKGARVLDSDMLVRELYARREFASQVQSLFKTPVLSGRGEVDRVALGAVVFADAAAMKKLEALVHPAVRALRDEKVARIEAGQQESGAKQGVMVYEAVKLLESGHGRGCHAILCVVADEDIQMQRLMERRGLTEREARARICAQPSRERKLQLAGPVPLHWLENNGSLEELQESVDRFWEQWRSQRSREENL